MNSNDGLQVFRTGNPSFARNSVSAFILVFGVFLRIYSHIWPRRGRRGSPRGSTCSRAWGNERGT